MNMRQQLEAQRTAPPNIMLILTDQFRPDALQYVQTPHLCALAQRGVTFANAYCASPLCQPSRTSLVHGSYPTSHGVCGNMNTPLAEAEREDTYPRHLQRAGYTTALIGKHHHIDRWRAGVDIAEDDDAVQSFGYDHVLQVDDDHLTNQDAYTRFLDARGKLEAFQEMTCSGKYDPTAFTVEEFDDGFIGEQAVAYIERYAQDAPFYLHVGFLGPHPPYWVPEPYASQYHPEASPAPKVPVSATEPDPRTVARAQRARAQYFGRIALIDAYVGRIVSALAQRGILDNTLIIFTADHGDLIGDYDIFDKRYFYEQSVRVPLIIAGPGVELNPRLGARTCRELVSGVDLYPTCLHVAGMTAGQENNRVRREGISLLDLANDRVAPRSAVFSELGTQMMVRDANWKFVYDAEGDGAQALFNLRRDPEELDNLAGVAGYEAVEARYTRMLLSRLIRLTHTTQEKERERLQRVRT